MSLPVAKIIKDYQEGKSVPEIAEEYQTYPNKISRLLIKNNIQIRSKAEAQALALKSGRAKHPTEDTKRDAETKRKIAESVELNWKNKTPDEIQAISEKQKQVWDSFSEEYKAEFQKKAIDSLHRATKEGSKLENFIAEYLREHGYSVIQRKKFLENEKLEVDIFLPTDYIVIEIDGPSHSLPIWGEESLKRTMKADFEKNGLLLQKGIRVIRIKDLRKNHSNIYYQRVAEELIKVLKNCTEKYYEVYIDEHI